VPPPGSGLAVPLSQLSLPQPDLINWINHMDKLPARQDLLPRHGGFHGPPSQPAGRKHRFCTADQRTDARGSATWSERFGGGPTAGAAPAGMKQATAEPPVTRTNTRRNVRAPHHQPSGNKTSLYSSTMDEWRKIRLSCGDGSHRGHPRSQVGARPTRRRYPVQLGGADRQRPY
jgi:hypothetical protein